jgi:hypothetical protein
MSPPPTDHFRHVLIISHVREDISDPFFHLIFVLRNLCLASAEVSHILLHVIICEALSPRHPLAQLLDEPQLIAGHFGTI